MDVDEDMVDARTPSSIVESSALSCSEHELEIPDFAKSWGRVRRPSRLPEDYDLRIDRAAIFILDGPSTHYERSVRNSKGASQQLVVAKRCDSCKISHAACSRRTGAESPCKKCRGSGHRCKTTDPGFDPLPKLPVKRKRIPSVAGASLETPSSESTTSRTSLRPRVKQESPAVVPIAPTTKRKRADIVHEPSEPSSSASAKAPNVRRKASMPRATTDMVSSSQGKAKKPRTSKINVPPVAVRAAAVKTPATRRTEQVESVTWRLVKPPSSTSGHDPRPQPAALVHPSVWASSRAELLDVIPALSKSVNGVAWEQMETPTLILDDSTVWPEDSWTGGAICLSMVRDFECNGPPPPRAVEAPAPAPQRTLKAADVQALIAHVGKRYAGVTEDVPMFADVDGGSRPDDAKVLDFIACADRRASEAMLNVVPPSIDVESAPARPDPLSRGSEHESRTSGRGAETGTMDTLAPFHLDQGPCNGPLPSFTEFMEISCPDDLNAPASDVACDNLSSNGPASSVIPRNWQQSALYGVDSYGPAGDDELRLNMDSTREPLPPIYDESPFCPVRVPPNVVEPPVADLAVKLENPSFAPFLYSFHGDAHVLPSVHAAHTEDERPNSMVDVSFCHETPIDPIVDLLEAPSSPLSSVTTIDGTEMDIDVKPPVSLSTSPATTPSPASNPPEIQVLQDAHEAGRPIVIVVSNTYPLTPFTLPPNCAYAYLGYFLVTDIKREDVELPSKKPSARRSTHGRVRWRISFEWVAGGESFLEEATPTTTPWWSSNDDSTTAPSFTPHRHIEELMTRYDSFLPHDIVDGANGLAAYDGGWYCAQCGKLNRRLYFRHCRCSNCQTNASNSRADALEVIRDTHQAVPNVISTNVYPGCVCESVDDWADGMRTYSYTICNGAVVKHIFTGNNPSLQTEASDLLVQIQLQVLLRYQTDGAWAATGSYFAHIAGQGQDAVPWSDAPQCLSQAREFLSSRGLYGELETFDVNKLVTLAWSGSAGGKKGSVIYAKASPVALLCLGTDTTFSLVPRSGFGGDTVVSGRSSENKKSSQGVGSSGHGPKAKASTASGGKTSEAIRVNLVHGDVLLLQGDDFEYSLTRTGTAMVLIGSAAT